MPREDHPKPRTPAPAAGLRLATLSAVAALALLAGCAQLPLPLQNSAAGSEQTEAAETGEATDTEETAARQDAVPEPEEDPEPGQLYEWKGDGRRVSRIVIDTREQRARFYEGPDQIGWSTIATGVSSHPTPRGEFEIIEKAAKKRSNLYGRIYDANGKLVKSNADSEDPIPPGGRFVGAKMPNFMRMTYDGIGMHAGAIPRPGQPASHGCIRLPPEVASSLFRQADRGTRVTVIGDGPDYGNYAKRIREQRREQEAQQAAEREREEATAGTTGPASGQDSGRSAPASAAARSAQTSSTAPDASPAPRLRAGPTTPTLPASEGTAAAGPPASPEPDPRRGQPAPLQSAPSTAQDAAPAAGAAPDPVRAPEPSADGAGTARSESTARAGSVANEPAPDSGDPPDSARDEPARSANAVVQTPLMETLNRYRSDDAAPGPDDAPSAPQADPVGTD